MNTLDPGVAYQRYKFIGHEFLTWLWFAIETGTSDGETGDPAARVDVGNRLVLENRSGDHFETITIKGDAPGLEEGRTALKKGAVVNEINIHCRREHLEWRFTLKGENLGLSNLRVPATGQPAGDEDIDGVCIEKAALCRDAGNIVDHLFGCFLHLRLSGDWHTRIVPSMKKWMAK
jgi:hypothetical protein